jgi:CBS domain-containing protein
MQLQVPIREHMSYPVATLSPSGTIADAMTIMYERKIRRVIIAEENRLVGIVTSRDIFGALINNNGLHDYAEGQLQDLSHHLKYILKVVHNRQKP